MALNPFLGWTVKDLEAELRAAQEDLAAGKATVGAGAGDVRSQSETQLSPLKRIELILRALNLLDSEKYPLEQITRITQTRASF